jgi:L-alanine-DL-glutamate epimerase-like enolase superfamily enzyme
LLEFRQILSLEGAAVKISDIEVIALRVEYPLGKGFWFSGGYCDARLSCLVRVYTDAGVTGLGSIYSHPELVRNIVEGHLRDLLIGEDPLQVESLWERNYTMTRWYGRKGVAVSALGGVDTALWDIRGKVARKPIHHLLGGERDQVPAYASALLWKDDPSDLGREAIRYLEDGFLGMKMRLGRNYEYDCAALDVVRKAIGSQHRLMIEGNARYSLAQAERIAPEFRTRDIFWLEEPFPPERPEDFLALRPKLAIPLAAGENEFGVQGFRELIDNGIVDIVQPDCSRAGGITECRRIGLLAAKHDLLVATHSWSDAVALVANMHLIASLPNGLTVEIDRTGNPLVDELLTEPLKVVDGKVALPKGPGLGVELDEQTLTRYTMPRGERIPPGIYSDMVFGSGNYKPAGPYERIDKETLMPNEGYPK